ncbi:MAG: tetratricopeptide repeat protein [Fimbriimonas sp.]|nr:tetratricopeptide repeat protein [Fimbriimonas sp.]
MKVAVLPFNATEGTKAAYGRQFAAFAAEQLRTHAQADINAVSYLTQIQAPDGTTRMAFVNIGNGLLPYEQLTDLFAQAQVDLVMDGSLTQTDDAFDLTLRFHSKESDQPLFEESTTFGIDELFSKLLWIVKTLANQAEIGLPEFLAGESMEFGTTDPKAFLLFLEGYDALSHVQQANGMVAIEFSPQPALDALLESVEMDKTFNGPYQVLVQFARACAHFRIGTFEMMDEALAKLSALVPTQFLAFFALGELHQTVNSLSKAADFYEKALTLETEDPAIYARLGIVQLQLGMPVNAERNFRRAFTMEGDDKPSGDYLAMVLTQTGRAHEVVPLWKGVVDENPQNAAAHAKYAVALFQIDKQDDAEKAFEHALEIVDENLVVKRFYAPWLVKKGDLDRAMDFYEDILDVAPNDIQVLTEYAQTLEAAGREFEVPQVMKDILASNPDPNTRAQALARLIELEQPKRVENVEAARMKMESGDMQGAISSLKPLRNWLADYWKLWAMLSSAYNATQQFTEAEEAARRLLELYPGCEPGYGELVNALHGQNKADEAYQLMKYAATHNPNSLPIHINLALAAKRVGQVQEARDLAKQIREAIGPNEELEPVLSEIER